MFNQSSLFGNQMLMSVKTQKHITVTRMPCATTQMDHLNANARTVTKATERRPAVRRTPFNTKVPATVKLI